MACEADLALVELLRRIFSRAVSPLLRMIGEFITVGHFDDPFNEFFIEMLQNADQVIFKLTSEPEKIPIFLAESVPMIFKIGSDIALLKQNR